MLSIIIMQMMKCAKKHSTWMKNLQKKFQWTNQETFVGLL